MSLVGDICVCGDHWFISEIVMEYNTCKTCGASHGMAGNLVNGNCYRCREKPRKRIMADMVDVTESFRRELTAEINAKRSPREAMEDEHGQCWDTSELQRDFEVTGFMAPFVIVRRKSDGEKGSLMFQHSPRIYYRFQEG